MDLVRGAAENAINTLIIVPLMQLINDVINLDENRRLVREQLDRMKGLLQDISYAFDNRQKSPPQSLRNCLERMEGEVKKARELIERSQRPHQCLGIDFAFLFNCRLSTQIREWRTTFNGLFDELRTDSSVLCSALQIASFSPRQAEVQIERWLTEAPQVRRIGVYGTSGVGKTTLLRKIYSAHKEVSGVFDAVIWVTVAQFPILDLQNTIASEVNLDLAGTDVDARKMQLSAHLKTKNFFIVLEDMWSTLDLEQLGVELNDDRASKLIFSTRNRSLVEEMKAEAECMKLEGMSTDESWDLFSKVAFKEGAGDHSISEGLENIARQVSSECKGLPLVINVIASSMIGKRDVNEWRHALSKMQSPDFVSPIAHHPRIDRDLFQKMRWSYDCLQDANLKNCFLYCAMFPQDTAFRVNPLLHMWMAESLIKTKDTGHRYVKILEDRCLFQVKHQENLITVHDAVRDMAIYIGETEENCVFRAGQMLQQFPEIVIDCKRISVLGNGIKSLPTQELRCQKLVTLFLGKLELKEIPELNEIPEAFLQGLTSLKVLDLSGTQLKSLPLSLWELRQLEFLNLSWTEIANLHEGIGNLSSLRFLNISHCSKLKSLPSQIGKLGNLKYFDFSNCNNLKVNPKEITKLSNCEIVQ